MKARSAAAGMGALALVWGCASGPSPMSEAVRGEFRQASVDPQITQYAPLALDDARKAVAQLERADRNGADESDVTHLSYLVRKRIDIARMQAADGALQERVKTLGKERDRLMLEAKTSEAQLAQSEAQRLRAEIALRDARRAEEERLRGDAALQEAQRANAQLEQQKTELEEQRAETERAQRELEQQKAESDRARERAEQLQRDNAQLQARETPEGIVLTMGDVLFATGRAELQPGGRDVMRRVAEYLNEFPDRSIEVAGHTDSVGDASYNQQLSERRAEAVAELLRAQGVSAGRLRVQGYGEDRPVAPNENLAGRQQNRRVEIILANAASAPAPQAGAARQGS